MVTDRRKFLDRLAVGAATLGGLGLGLGAMPAALEAAGITRSQASDWDTRWLDRMTGSVRTVFDVPEIESGVGVWRASMWPLQHEQVFGVPARECSTALVLRHNAIVLAMQQAFWDRYGLGKDGSVTHPMTDEPTTRNPALFDERDGLPEPISTLGLHKFHERGGITLACDLALSFLLVPVVQQVDGVSAEVARERAIAQLIPGVILQPSGVFATLVAQQRKQASYIRAS